MSPHDNDGTGLGGRAPTEIEDRLTRALAARADQVTHHSLRPGAPPSPNWAARGRGPLVLALAAGVAAVALVGGAAVSYFDRAAPERAPVAGEPSPPAPVSGSPSPSPSPGGSASPGATGSPDPSGSSGAPDPDAPDSSESSTDPASRTVTVAYGTRNQTFALRTGSGVASLSATVTNNLGEAVLGATDMLTIVPEGGSLRPGDVNVSVRDGAGGWRPVGRTTPEGYEARLTGADGGDLGAGASRTHEVRVSLGAGFPSGVGRLRVSLFSEAGAEELVYGG
ncbi:hypothetical protein [Streptomyces sp. NPDC050504]|uniref:hypothetical protein n=1 Tax=Streptomyces sp. NPDC050504 TaxID=3365618 RepID=UPI0037BCBE65